MDAQKEIKLAWKSILAALLSAALVSAATGCSRESASIGAGGQGSADPAMVLVRRLNMGGGLESLAVQAAHATTTYRVLVREHGERWGGRARQAGIATALPAYQPRWDANLAGIYARHFSNAELASLAAEGRRSPYVGKFESTHAQIGAEMRSASSPLLEQLVTEALTHAVNGPVTAPHASR